MGRPPNSSPQTRAVLQALGERPRDWQHGYELCKKTKLRSGTLYPLLIRLHDRGLLEAEWRSPESPGRPPRHAYRLTAAGLAFAMEPRPSLRPSGVLRLGESGAR